MEERKIVQLKKEEFAIKEEIKKILGKGKVSKVRIEYTPIGEKIIVSTHKPGLVIGKKGERIDELTKMMKKKFNLENPRVEIDEIFEAELDAQLMADEIAMTLERLGPLKFKVVSYRTLQKIMKAGALGAELRLSGKLPGSRAKVWRFAQGYLKKAGDTAKIVNKAQALAFTKPGVVGVKVSILPPNVKLIDRIDVDENLIAQLKINMIEEEKPVQKVKAKKQTATRKTKKVKEEKGK